MPDSLFTYALFFVPLFFIGACLLTGLPVALSIQDHYKNRGRQGAKRQAATAAAGVAVDRQLALRTRT